MKRKGLHLRASVAFLLFVLSGCGSSEYSSTEGMITLDGIPLPNATVLFYAPNMPLAAAKTDGRGRYRVETGGATGMRPGAYSVTIAAYGTDANGHPVPMLVVPKRYLRSESSGLKVNISSGANRNVDFDLNTGDSVDSKPSADELGRMSSVSNEQQAHGELAITTNAFVGPDEAALCGGANDGCNVQ